MVARRRVADLGFSLLIIAFGCYVVYSGALLPVGSMKRIGPGFFPICLGATIAILGVLSLFDRDEGAGRERFNLFGLCLVGLAILSFGLLVEPVGLFPAVAAVVLLTNLAGRERTSVPVVLATIAGLCAAGQFIFIAGLQLPLEPFAGRLFPGN